MTIEAEALRVLAPAKINLFLHVGDKRGDGYHALESLVVFASVADELAFAPDRSLRLVVQGPFGSALTGDPANLVLTAAHALAEQAQAKRGAYIVLKKNLPIASGIGGGSSDSAATLRGLSRLWNLNLPYEALCRIAERIGSDVPVCVACVPAWMEGRGEVVAPSEAIPPLAFVLVNPGVAVPTSKVFGALRARRGLGHARPGRLRGAADLVAYLRTTTNDLEEPARSIAPEIGAVLQALEALPGVLLARMSGSGATCFAIFESDAAAEAGAEILREAHADWWIAPCRNASRPV